MLAIWFAALSVDRWRLAQGCEEGEGVDALPTALITETAHGPRIEAVNAAGHVAGARPAMMLADARTLCPDIQTAPSDPAGDLAALEKLALWAQRWGPWSALDPPDGVLVDITAAAHLFGGEARLLRDVGVSFAQRKLKVGAAIGPTAGAAWAMAHYAKQSSIVDAGEPIMRALNDLPVAALRLDADVLTVLRRLGLKRLQDLHNILRGAADRSEAAARDALHRRFRNRKSPSANPLIRLDQLLGKVPEPLLPVAAQVVPMVQRRLVEPIRHRALLDKVLEDLTADMQRTLEAHGEGARRLELGLWRVDGEVVIRVLELAAAAREADHIIPLFAHKLENIDAGFGIETVRLRASWTEPLAMSQGDIEAAAERHGTSLAACVDRLSVRLGPDAVRRPVGRASHLPERSQIWQAPLERLPSHTDRLPTGHIRPLKILDKPERISVLYATPDGYPQRFSWRGNVRDIVRVEGPERMAPEWWRERSTARLRDYYRIEDSMGERYWIYRHGLAGDGRGGAPIWYLHGLAG